MTPEQFTYWLQGFVELCPENPPSLEQWRSIQAHLQTVFWKETPPLVPVDAPKHKLNQLELDPPSYAPRIWCAGYTPHKPIC